MIDFGSAIFDDGYHSSIVSTRHYRAPEIVLSIGWSFECDIWSLGCILVELITGDALFQTHENLEHLAMMERVLGPLPSSIVEKATAVGWGRLFTKQGTLHWPKGSETPKSLKAVGKLTKLKEYLKVHSDSTVHCHIPVLVDLLEKMLEYEPEARCTAEEALNHPFFSLNLD